MDAIDLLEEQHRDVEDLFEEIEQAEASEKREIFEEIADQLAIHATIEEKHFYPAANDKSTESLLKESLEEHLSVKRLIADLLELDAKDGTFDAKIKVLKEQVEQHVKEEEKELFPKVRKLLDKEMLDALAQEMTATQESLIDDGEPRERVKSETAEAPSLR
jgi:hemerythrin-like domain-containing protein